MLKLHIMYIIYNELFTNGSFLSFYNTFIHIMILTFLGTIIYF